MNILITLATAVMDKTLNVGDEFIVDAIYSSENGNRVKITVVKDDVRHYETVAGQNLNGSIFFKNSTFEDCLIKVWEIIPFYLGSIFSYYNINNSYIRILNKNKL